MTAPQATGIRTAAGVRRRSLVAFAVIGLYGLIATVTALLAFAMASRAGRSPQVSAILIDHYLAIAPWLPATALIARQTPRAFRHHRIPLAIGSLAALGVAVVGAINLVQAALLTTVGGSRHVAWLDQYADGLLAAGHFGFLWYVVVTLAVYIVVGDELRVTGPSLSAPDHQPQLSTIEVGTGHGRIILRLDEIDWIEARRDYVRIHAQGRCYLKLERMKVLEGVLDPSRFARVHRSAIVNLDRVREFHPVRRGDYQLILASGARLRLARSRREAVLTRLRATGR